jgi:ABC-type Fe3+/spermidine/putrescine transport system ATPase subunit
MNETADAQSGYLRLDGVGKRYHEGGGIDDITLSVDRGSMLVLLGPSGSGKTTLLRSIAGLESPDTGDVVIGGATVTRTPVYKRGIGMVFQTWALFPYMSVFDNVAFGLKMAGAGRKDIERKAMEALELVRMDAFARRRPNQLSGGQQQRVALARAIVTRPKVLLFDEPLSSLDQKIRLELRSQLRQIQRELGLTGVYVTHDHAEALALGDRIVVMNEGRVVEQGSPMDVFVAPKHAFTAEFLSVGTVSTISSVDVGDNSVETEDGVRVRVSSAGIATAVPGKSVLIPTRAVAIVATTGTASLPMNSYAGEIVNVEFEQASILCTVRLTQSGVLIRSSEPLDSAVSIGTPVEVAVDAEKVLVLES